MQKGDYAAEFLQNHDLAFTLVSTANFAKVVNQRTRELSRSEEKYRVLVESSHDLIWEMDKQLRFSYISPNVTTLLGYDS
ncbi:MAG TPA: PAS domain S-box protein [Proteobacteria bacterium]|nr:PAS domain S-box protein [Pseudomonadota bacterium]